MEPKFYRDLTPTLLRLEARSGIGRLQAAQFRQLAAVLAALLIFGMALTWSRVRVLANSYQIMELKAERDRLGEQALRCRGRLAHMRSLAYAEEVARGRLGMVDISPNQVVVLGREGAVGRLWKGVSGWFGGGRP